MGTGIANITAAKRALAKASTLDEVLEIRDKAEAIRAYMRAASESLDAQNAAADIKLRAERKAGELLAEMEGSGKGGDRKSSNAVLLDLAKLGITKMQSSRWQLAAQLPEEEYIRLVTSCNDAGKELTQITVLRAARIYAFGESEAIETQQLTSQKQNTNLLDLIVMARAAVADLVESFGESHIQTLIGVLKDEIETLEGRKDDNN
jgi:hypothetical protein